VRLADALRVTPRRTVAFIGAGGKSTALARLAAELAAEGPVVITTTTKLALSQAALAESHLDGVFREPHAAARVQPLRIVRDHRLEIRGDEIGETLSIAALRLGDRGKRQDEQDGDH